jgi:hypothetical protein
MNTALRVRDPGLQPERTALSWHRTAFSSLILALVTIRSGVSQQDLLLTVAGGIAMMLSLLLVFISFGRQKLIVQDTELTSQNAILAKFLICSALGINALAVVLHSALNLY